MAAKKKSPPVNWKSRKIWFSGFAIVALLVGLHLTEDSAALATVYSSYAGSVVTITGLLIAGNVGSKFVNIKKALTGDKDNQNPPTE